MSVELEDRVAASLRSWADNVAVGAGDAAGSIGLARRRRAARRSTVAAAALIVGVLGAFVVVRPTASTVHTAGAPDATMRGASAPPLGDVPHIMLPGFRTTYFVALPTKDGTPSYVEYQFESDAGTRMQVSFYSGDLSVRTDGEARRAVSVRGADGSLLEYGGGRYRVDWLEGGRVWEADGGSFDSVDSFVATVAGLQRVDDATWTASLPAGITMTADRPAAVARLLEGVPLPADFDRAALDNGPPASPYYLATDVYGKVACAWIGEWGAARAAGDAARTNAAASALAGSRDWPGLQATTSEGAYAEVLWDLATRVGAGDPSVLDSYESALGC